jgi:RNA-directed DNA polymerase
MKRVGNLMAPIAEMENLRLAFWKARRGKNDKPAVISFRTNLNEELLILRQELLAGEVNVGKYHYFTINDPKERNICAADFSERVLHHALMNVCHPIFERVQIFDSYASRKGKGTYAALERAASYTAQYKWYLKLDVRKYFDSINHSILKKQLSRIFKDAHLLAIFNQIIDSYALVPNKGVPIGNLTSQYFANHYLAVADHYAKEQLKIPAYVRYMDDMVLWHNDKQVLLKIGKLFEQFIEKELDLELRPFCLNKSSKGLPFLSYLLCPSTIRLAQRSKKRFIRKMNYYNQQIAKGIWSQKDYQKHVLPLIAFTEKANAKFFRKQVLAQIGQLP